MNVSRTNIFEYEAETVEPGHAPRKLGLLVYTKGDRRLTEFTAPADLKGTKVLVLSPTEMYAYLPAFGKVRRIASHTSDQSAFGMTFSQDDFAVQRYLPDYTATVRARTADQIQLVLTPRPGGKGGYGKLELDIMADNVVPAEIRYYDSAGILLKTETRTGYSCLQGACVPGELKMVDQTKGGMWTRITRKSWKVNEPISDDLLSKRSLVR